MIELVVFLITAFLSYWYETEAFLFLGSLFIMGRFLRRWYRPIINIWPPNRNKMGQYMLIGLPAMALTVILTVLLTTASFDVVGIWVVFYVVLGFAWIPAGIFFIEYLLDLSWSYDIIQLDNKAAIFPVASGFLGLTLIYTGANIGDGPGWWVVFIAGGLGLIAWLVLALLINIASGISEKITVNRDTGCGIRFGAYLLASGLILARASGGDWTSFQATLVEFLVGWPVLPLALFALLVELYFTRASSEHIDNNQINASAILGCVYMAYAVIALILLPSFDESPLYMFYR